MPSKWVRDAQSKHHNEHMERIKNMQPVVDNKKPRELPMSGKKEIERRQFRNKIEKGNRLLLDRLGKALERKNIDNERKAIKFNSLEQGKKKLELKRVTMENQLLLNRIQFAQPMYNHHQWERDAEHREFYLKNMTEFPELYCPHHPPLREKWAQEQDEKKAEKDAQTLSKLNRTRTEKGLAPLQILPHRKRDTDEDAPGRGPFGQYKPGTSIEPPKTDQVGINRPLGSPVVSGQLSTHQQQLLAAVDNIDQHDLMHARTVGGQDQGYSP